MMENNLAIDPRALESENSGREIDFFELEFVETVPEQNKNDRGLLTVNLWHNMCLLYKILNLDEEYLGNNVRFH